MQKSVSFKGQLKKVCADYFLNCMNNFRNAREKDLLAKNKLLFERTLAKKSPNLPYLMFQVFKRLT